MASAAFDRSFKLWAADDEDTPEDTDHLLSAQDTLAASLAHQIEVYTLSITLILTLVSSLAKHRLPSITLITLVGRSGIKDGGTAGGGDSTG